MAEVHLTEVLYNGCWMYTAATIQLVNPEDTLFMPGVLTSMKGMRQSCGKTEKGYGALLL